MTEPLTDHEKAYFDTLRDKAKVDMRGFSGGGLVLMRMTLDGRDVAVVATSVFNAITGQPEGVQPLALLLTDDDLVMRLRDVDGNGPASVSPFDLDPDR